MEGYERNLEAHAGNEEEHAEEHHGIEHLTVAYCLPDTVEVEGAGDTVDEADAEEQQGSGEECEQNELGTGFGAFVAVLVEGHGGSHGDAGGFKTDEEHEEVSAGNHEVHSKQCEEGDEVELALLYQVFLARQPFVGHQEGDDGADGEDALDDGHHRGVLIHASEGFAGFMTQRAEIKQSMHGEKHHGQTGIVDTLAVLAVRTHEEVSHKEDDDHGQERKFGLHIQKLTVIHLGISCLEGYIKEFLGRIYHADDGRNTRANHVAYPPGSKSETGNAEDEADNAEALVPGGVGEGQVMLVRTYAVENLADKTEDVDCGDDDGGAGDDGEGGVECTFIAEGAYEDGHFGHEAGETGKTEVGKTGNDVAYCEERHDAHQTGELTDVAGVGTAIDHTDEGKEEGRHQTVGKHLKDGACAGHLVHHQNGEEHKTAVAYRRVGIDILEVGLDAGAEGTVNYGDAGEDKEYPSQFIGGFGHQIHGNAEAAVASELHEHAGVEHRNCRGGGSMTVGRPGVEGEHGTEDTETCEGEDEPEVLETARLEGVGTAGVVGDVDDVHRSSAGAVVDTEDTAHQEGGTSHQHQRKLHGRVLLLARTPYADEEVHGDKGDFIEHEHGEHVYADEKAEYAHREKREPKEVFLGQRFQLPAGKGSGEDDDGTQQKHGHGDAVDTDAVLDVQGREPVEAGGIEHGIVTRLTVGDENIREIYGKSQKSGAACHHHATHLVEVACHPQAEEHQQGDENKY